MGPLSQADSSLESPEAQISRPSSAMFAFLGPFSLPTLIGKMPPDVAWLHVIHEINEFSYIVMDLDGIGLISELTLNTEFLPRLYYCTIKY